MSLSNNYPTIRPTLEFDFANVGALDPRITFTRATSATFVNQLGVIQTAASGIPRFDYDPSTLAARGLLVEEQRTNTCTYSEDITAVAWKVDSATRTSNAATSPDGTVNADSVTYTASTGKLIRENAYQISVSGSTTYTISVWLRVTSGTFKLKLSRTNGATWATATLSPELTVTTTWQRFTLTYTSDAGDTLTDIVLGSEDKTPYTLPATGTVLVWGFQHEAGSFATSYIPTVASTVTRNADVASVDTLTPWWNASAATFYIENTFGSFYNQPIALAGQAAVGNAWIYAAVSPGGLIKSYTIGAAVDLSSGITVSANVIVKSAFTYGASGKAISVNGSTPVVSGNTTEPTASTQLNLGNWPGGNYHINGHIGRVAYYPARLTNAQLQALTS